MLDLDNDARNTPTISDERIRNVLRRELNRSINVERRITRAELSNESGVKIHQIDQLLTRDRSKKRRVTMEDAFSLAEALGDRCIRSLLATLNWVGHAVDDTSQSEPMVIAANCLSQLAVIAHAAANNDIDHVEQPRTTEAADMIIAELVPLSSAGRAA